MSEEKNMTEEKEMPEKKISQELQEYLQNKIILPCSIKINGGNFEYSNCFNKVPIEKLELIKKQEYQNVVINIEEKNKTIGILDINNYTDINIINFDSLIQNNVMNVNNKLNKSRHYIGKYILYSIDLKPDFFIFSNFYLERFNQIAGNEISSDIEKAKELDDIFKTIGYYAPLQIEIGGMFITDMKELSSSCNKDSSSKIKSELKSDKASNQFELNKMNSSDLLKLFKSEKKVIKGGDINTQDFEKWKETINMNNADIISYKNLMKLQDLLDYKIKNALRKPLELVEKKYQIRKKYFEIIENLKEQKKRGKIEGVNSDGNGITQESNEPKIVRNNLFKINAKSKFLASQEHSYNQYFDDIIVGWKIISKWNDGTNGKYIIKEDPLLTHSVNMNFFSKFCRGQRFDIEIYTMKIPD